MIENRLQILDGSKQTIEELRLLGDFFDNTIVMKIYLQTQVIHRLFEDNIDLDINKLELYHIQFTTTLITLLDKIKSKNERIVNMNITEIQINSDMIEKIRTSILAPGGYEYEKKAQSKRVGRSIYNFHKALASQSSDYPFTENLSSFSLTFYKEHFYNVDRDLQNKLLNYTSAEVYRNSYGIIGRKILSSLVDKLYKIIFFAGIQAGTLLMEIYKIQGEEKYMLFAPSKNLFLSCDINLFPYKEWEEENFKKEYSVRDLLKKNIELERENKEVLKKIDSDIIDLLNSNLQTITDIDFLEDLENIDIQANTLRSMLETKMI